MIPPEALQAKIRPLIKGLIKDLGLPEDLLARLHIPPVQGPDVHLIIELLPAEIPQGDALKAALMDHIGPLLAPHTLHILLAAQTPASQPASPPSARAAPQNLPGVQRILAVASAKGGVGKSTTAALLALSFQQQGWSVGILDADIYGPSLPHLTGLEGPPTSDDGTIITPLMWGDVPCMSMGFMIPPDKAAVWRGPMIHHALRQMLFQVAWPPLDLLVIDLPPGTGDISLSLVQMVAPLHVVLVSTAEALALMDVRRSLQMFNQLGTPVLGVIHNMSHLTCPSCTTGVPLFGATLPDFPHPLLGSIPLDRRLQVPARFQECLTEDDPLGTIYRTLTHDLRLALEGDSAKAT